MKNYYIYSKLAVILAIGLYAISMLSCSSTEIVSSRRTDVVTIGTPTIVIPGCSAEEDNPSLRAYCLFNSAVLLQSEGYSEQAKKEFLEVISLDDKRVEAYNFLGDIYFEEGSLIEAEKMYIASIELDAENPVPFHNLGVIYDSSGKQEQAIASYLESIRLNPNDAEAHYNLGLAYSRNLESIEGALVQFQRAIKLDPALADVHYDLGRIYEYLNRSTLANEHYKKAMDLGSMAATKELNQPE